MVRTILRHQHVTLQLRLFQQSDCPALDNDLVAELEEQGCEPFIERQNPFRVESTRSGAVIGGKPDLIAVFPDGRTVVYDVKTGQESASHIVQVQLYMYLVPRVPRQPFLPDASIDFAALTPSLTVDSALHRYDNL